VSSTSRILVPFNGDGAGTEELSWGQRELWLAIRRQRNWLPIGAVTTLPADRPVDDVVAELRFMMSRYPTMRTRLWFGDACEPNRDRGDGDGPRQVVAGQGEIALEVVDAGEGEDPAAVAALVDQRYRETDYDFATQWPVRMAVVRHRGVLTHQVTVMCHLVTDGAGAAVLAADLVHRQPQTATAMPPTAQARWQRTAAGRRFNDAALRRWEAVLRTIAPRRFRGSYDPRQPRHWEAEFSSPAMQLAVRAIAGRTRVETSPLLLALFAVSLARLTGIHPVVIQVVVSNRFRPGLADTVSPINQTGLCVLEVAGMTVDEVIAGARRKTMAAYKYAYYDPYQLDDLAARVGRERREELDISCYFNDRRLPPPGRTVGPAPTPGQIRAALPQSTFRWSRRKDYSFEPLFLHVEDVPDRIALIIAGDTHCVSPADLEACVRGMEAIAVEAAFDPAVATRVPLVAASVLGR